MGTLQTIFECYRKYFAAGGINVLLLVSLFWLYKRRRQKKIRPVIQITMVLIGIIVFPVSAKVIMLVIGADVYWRVFWMLPAVLVLAYAGVEFVWEQGSGGRRALTALACVGLIAVNGTLVFGSAFFKPKENNFKLPTAVVQVANAINEHAATYRIRRKRVLSPTSIAQYIRIYDASIRQPYGRYAMMHESKQREIYRQINADQPDYEVLAKEAHTKRWGYVVMTSESDNRAAMESYDFECIYEGGGYVIYFDIHRYRYKERKARGITKDWPMGQSLTEMQSN